NEEGPHEEAKEAQGGEVESKGSQKSCCFRPALFRRGDAGLPRQRPSQPLRRSFSPGERLQAHLHLVDLSLASQQRLGLRNVRHHQARAGEGRKLLKIDERTNLEPDSMRSAGHLKSVSNFPAPR